jgi:hypothetical protein
VESETHVTVVVDPEILAALLAAAGPRPLLPELSYARVRLGYSRGMREEVRRLLKEKGLAAEEVEAALAALRRQGEELEPGPDTEAFADPARDEPLRLAVAAPPAIYVTADEGLAELGVWKGVDVVGDLEEVRRLLLSYEDTAIVYRARSEPEAIRVAEALEEAGIEAQVLSQQVPWYDGVLVVGQGYWGEIMVFAKDRARAEEIITGLGL